MYALWPFSGKSGRFLLTSLLDFSLSKTLLWFVGLFFLTHGGYGSRLIFPGDRVIEVEKTTR